MRTAAVPEISGRFLGAERRYDGVMRLWILLGAVNGFLSVALGAFAAHGLKARAPADQQAWFETGARYHMYHALALVLLGLFVASRPSTMANAAGWSFVAGITLFSGSLYVMGVSGIRALGAITPFGGLGFLAGWALFALATWRSGS